MSGATLAVIVAAMTNFAVFFCSGAALCALALCAGGLAAVYAPAGRAWTAYVLAAVLAGACLPGIMDGKAMVEYLRARDEEADPTPWAFGKFVPGTLGLVLGLLFALRLLGRVIFGLAAI